VTSAAPFIPAFDDARPFAAELWLVLGIAGNLLVPFVTRRPNLICAMLTLLVLVVAAGSLLTGGLGAEIPVQHLRGMLLFDSTALIAKATLLLFVSGVVLLWIGHSGRTLREGDAPEFFTLLLGSTLGMCLMTSTTNLLMVFMAIAIASLPSYLLSGFAKGSRQAAEASLKYVLFGAVTGAMMIYGISFLYGIYGTLQVADLMGKAPVAGASAALSLALIGLLIGIGFKISAVPFHFWCPDVFEGATIEVTTFLSVASKGAALILLLRIVQGIGGVHAGMIVGVLGVLTATVGNTAAFAQTNIKRLLAYSSIAQAGYMMCLVSAAGDAGETAGGPVTQALLLYLIIYAVMNLGAFSVAAVVIRQSGEQLENFAGLGRTSPLLAGAFFCCLISLIGLPPFAGFGAKVNILWVLAHGGGFGLFLVAAIVLNTALSAFYYFRVIRVMYLERSNDRSRIRSSWTRDPLGLLLASVCAGGLVVMFFAFQFLYAFTSRHPASPAVTAADRGVLPAIKNS
jgi:NADH-quinone oxidoreductase subunit N